MKDMNILNDEIDICMKYLMEENFFSASGIDMDKIMADKKYFYQGSVNQVNGDVYVMIKLKTSDMLFIYGRNKNGFKGIKKKAGKSQAFFCPADIFNSCRLRKVFPFTSPVPLSSYDKTIGLGDRLGIVSPGHIRIINKYKAYPVLAQQSVREITLTGRSYNDVLDAASWACFQEGYKKPWGADGDHLKTEEWVKLALKTGFTMITADVSDFIRKEYSNIEYNLIENKYKELPEQYRKDIEKKYLDNPLKLESGDIILFEKNELMKTVLIYREAIDHAEKLYFAGKKVKKEFDFELSIDETETPTTPQAHVFVAKESIERGIVISSLAPRFVGEFQKGIDYIGDPAEFEKLFKIHNAVCVHFGYRISIHSGSDKFKVFPAIGKIAGKFHVKTAGTNWLQALDVIAVKNPGLFKKLYDGAVRAFPEASKYYHITPNLRNVPDISGYKDIDLEKLFENQDVRQVLHIAYGELFKIPGMKEEIYNSLRENIDAYWLSAGSHIDKHLKYLGIGLN
jgi:tagaturonate epimerase